MKIFNYLKTSKPKSHLKIVLAATCLLLLLASAIYKLNDNPNKAYATGTPSSATPCVGNPAPAQWKHVVVLMFENRHWGDVVGNPSAPYISDLVAKCGTAYSGSSGSTAKNNWHDANWKVNGTQDGSYNSKPNYATLTSGVPPSVHGLVDDQYTTTTNVDNIYKHIIAAGKNAKNYYSATSTSTPCAKSNFPGAYHDAIRYFIPTIGIDYCNSHDVPVSTFMTDVNNGNLPDWSMILPTNCENMHSCSSIGDTTANADTWAQNFLTPLFNSDRYKSGDTAVFFLWDEDTAIPNALIAPSVLPGSKVPVPSGNPISHYSALRTWSEMLGLPYIGDSGQAPSLLSFFNGGGTATPPPTVDNPPAVNITAPVTGTTLTASPVSLKANATDDKGISKVEFYDAATLLGTDTTSPYSFNWDISNLAGNHSLTAKAFDTGGHSTISLAVTVNIAISSSCPALSTSKGTASNVLNVTSDGNYHVWSRIMAPDSNNNSYYLQIDSACAVLVGDSANLPSSTWTWVDYQNANAASHITANLAAGQHTFTMIGRENGVKLDRVILVSDTCTPNGTGENCTDTTAPSVSVTAPNSGSTFGGTTTIAASASDNDGGSGIASVSFFMDGRQIGSVASSPYQISWDSKSVADGGHTVLAEAMDAAGNVGTSSSISFNVKNADITPPSTPSNLIVTKNSYSEVALSWSASTDNIAVNEYKVFRNSVHISTVNATSYSDKTVTPNTNYSYTVVAVDAAGNQSSPSTGLTVITPPSPDVQPPTAPSNLTATVKSATRVDLSWNPSSDNVGVKKYYIQRNGVVIAASDITSYSDTSTQPETTYTYLAYAVDAAGNNSPASITKTVTTPSLPDTTAPSAPTNLTSGTAVPGQVDLSWDASTDNVGVAGYYIYRNNSIIATTTVTEFGDATVTNGQSYTYYVVAFDATKNRSQASNQVAVTVVIPNQVETLKFKPTDDATINRKYPNNNYGNNTRLTFGINPARRSLLKFKISGINGRLVTSAKLQLRVGDSSNYGGNFQALISNHWNQTNVTWNNAPANTGVNLASRSSILKGTYVTIDLSNYITGDGTYSLEIISRSSDTGKYYSRESTIKPLLNVTVQ